MKEKGGEELHKTDGLCGAQGRRPSSSKNSRSDGGGGERAWLQGRA